MNKPILDMDGSVIETSGRRERSTDHLRVAKLTVRCIGELRRSARLSFQQVGDTF